jgi:hypothetical protein
MIKELVLAIVLGALLGLGVTGGYLALNKKNTKIDQPKQQVEITTPTAIPTASENSNASKLNENSQLNITSPQADSLVATDKIDIEGITTANSLIVVTTTSKTFSGKSDQKGQFSIPITIDSGINFIKISAIDQNNNQFDTQVNVTYSTAKI